MTTILQRVCWNTDSWKKPSHETIDSGNPGKHGYGNEEWNFCTTDKLDGNVYGWLHWRAKRFTDESFQILFWSINRRREWVLVGAYLEASLAAEDELRTLRFFFEKEGISKRRLFEALSVVSPDQRDYVRKHPPTDPNDLRFKCPVDKVVIFQPQIPYSAMPKRFRSKNARFTNPIIFKESMETLLPSALNKPHPSRHYVMNPLVEEVYPRATSASLSIIIPRHKELCNKFIRWLDRTGRKVVGREKDRVDVEFEDRLNYCRAELKVCYGMTPKSAIREALGQLLEYNYYGWRVPADRWLIVLDSAPSENDMKYVHTLREKKDLPLQLWWRSGRDFVDTPTSTRRSTC
jgi:hypothetical protein